MCGFSKKYPQNSSPTQSSNSKTNVTNGTAAKQKSVIYTLLSCGSASIHFVLRVSLDIVKQYLTNMLVCSARTQNGLALRSFWASARVAVFTSSLVQRRSHAAWSKEQSLIADVTFLCVGFVLSRLVSMESSSM